MQHCQQCIAGNKERGFTFNLPKLKRKDSGIDLLRVSLRSQSAYQGINYFQHQLVSEFDARIDASHVEYDSYYRHDQTPGHETNKAMKDINQLFTKGAQYFPTAQRPSAQRNHTGTNNDEPFSDLKTPRIQNRLRLGYSPGGKIHSPRHGISNECSAHMILK